MRRRILIVLLAIGTVAGFASGFAHLHQYRGEHWRKVEDHMADVCVRAAERAHPAPAKEAR